MLKYFITWENQEGYRVGEIVEGTILKLNNFIKDKKNPKIKQIR